MTAIIGIRCTDGVVIGADSSVSFGDGGQFRTIEQITDKKIEIVEDFLIVAGTGYVGHMQRFCHVVGSMYRERFFIGKSEIEISREIAKRAVTEFRESHAIHGLPFPFSAFVAFPANNETALAEFPGGTLLQPELKRTNDLWFTTAGSGQPLTDPFLAMIRNVFWPTSAPNLAGGIFAAVWALQHACELNTGGIKGPIRIAVLSREKGKFRARTLDDTEIADHETMVREATAYLAKFRAVLEGKGDVSPVPLP